MEHKNIQIAEEYSEKILNELRDEIKSCVSGSDFSIVTTGSFARREASEVSDIDYFFIFENNDDPKKIKAVCEAAKIEIQKIVNKMPSTTGAFGGKSFIEDMLNNIGGNNDTNNKLTRRILLLLESDWIFGKDRLVVFRRRILDRYVKNTITDHQLCRFLLNDIIRYYRTICVDFEYKTEEESKPWGTRNVKLAFSRKLLYFSGVLVVGETAQRTYRVKMDKLERYFSMHPIERINKICGQKAEQVLVFYDEFIKTMSNIENRKVMDAVTSARDTHSEEFRKLKNEGHHFTWALGKLLHDTYPETHPIHTAIVF